MASTSVLEGNVHVAGTLSATAVSIPAGTVTNSAIQAAAGIEATKVVHQVPIVYTQPDGTAVVAETRGLRIARAPGTTVAVEAVITGAIATGADRTVTIDVRKGAAGVAYASILTATMSFNNADVLRTVKSATISTAAYSDNDSFIVVVTVAGAAGAQAQGLLVTITQREDPQ